MVDRVKGVEKVTDNPFLNLYNFDVEKRNGKTGKYYVASRKKDPTQLKAATHKNTSDGVIIYSVYGEKKDKIVLIKQFRYPINAYVYEFPAGLVEPGEEMAQAGKFTRRQGLFSSQRLQKVHTQDHFLRQSV